jgi:arylsulfatase A-like enzyme/Flp pilus assembly protein TadD
MRITIAVSLVLAFTACQQKSASPPPSQVRPDVILVTIDTLRADRISPYGYSKPTPAFEAFAKDSALFERASSQVPLTLPSHASILTGLYPITHGVRENSGFVLSPDQRTLAEILKENCYSAAAFIGAFVLDRRFGLARGFDTYYDNFPTGTLEDVKLLIQERRAGEVLEKAREWLATPVRGPRFAWIHLYDPHAPYEPPAPFDRDDDLYDGEVRYVDASLGDFFRYLRERGLYEEALIIVTSDHGEGLGEHGEETHGMFLYESTLHVPLMIKCPRNANAGVRLTEPALLIDIFPTVLNVLNIQDHAATQGKVLQPQARPAGRRNLAETMLPYLGYGWSPLRAYVDGSFKYIEAPRAELYDLDADPGETRNLISSNQAMAGQLRQRLSESVGRLSSSVPKSPQKVDAETSERMRSLGYLSASPTARSALPAGLADPKDKITIFEQIWKAESQLAAGKAADAARSLEKIIALDKKVYLARWLLGLAYYTLNRHAEALPCFLAAATLRPEESRPFMYAGMAALRLGRLQQARSALEQARTLQPGDEAVLNNLASVYANMRDLDRAAGIFRELTTRNADDVAAWTNLGVVLLLKKDYTPAYDSFQRALRLNPDQPEIHNNIGLVQMERGEVDAAVASYRQAIALRPEYGRAHYNLGIALQKKGLKTEAKQEFSLARQSGR